MGVVQGRRNKPEEKYSPMMFCIIIVQNTQQQEPTIMKL
jgi:hypothetical protein